MSGFNSQLAKAVGYDPSYPGLGLISATPLSLSTSSSDETINGACDGTATATVSGGIGPYNYSWDDPASQTNALASGLCAGTYSVTVTDANCDELIAAVSVGSGGSTAVISKTGNSSFILYPNPASTQLTIELGAEMLVLANLAKNQEQGCQHIKDAIENEISADTRTRLLDVLFKIIGALPEDTFDTVGDLANIIDDALLESLTEILSVVVDLGEGRPH